MFKKSFIGLVKPRIDYTVLTDSDPAIIDVATTGAATLLLECCASDGDGELKLGDEIKTGQLVSTAQSACAASPVTGAVTGICEWAGDYGCKYTAISLDVAKDEAVDEQFAGIAKEISLDDAVKYLSSIPGNPPLQTFQNPNVDIHTIVISGMDDDVLMTVNQYIVQQKLNDLKAGVAALKKITGVNDVAIAVPERLASWATSTGASVKTVSEEYPYALPKMVLMNQFDTVVPAGKEPEDLGYCFMSAEAVASIGVAVDTGSIPTKKLLTLVRKDGSASLVSAQLGSSVKDVLKACDIEINEKDQVIFGGAFTGSAVYSEDHPISADTNAVMIQDAADIPLASDYPCINCGECIRVCPVKIQVSMLVRFLEAGQYEDAADLYDLESCIDCGLCSFVCTSSIPIFQYIKLGKYELDRIRIAEAENV